MIKCYTFLFLILLLLRPSNGVLSPTLSTSTFQFREQMKLPGCRRGQVVAVSIVGRGWSVTSSRTSMDRRAPRSLPCHGLSPILSARNCSLNCCREVRTPQSARNCRFKGMFPPLRYRSSVLKFRCYKEKSVRKSVPFESEGQKESAVADFVR